MRKYDYELENLKNELKDDKAIKLIKELIQKAYKNGFEGVNEDKQE